MSEIMEKQLLTVKQVAEMLNVTERTIRNLIKANKLRKINVLGAIRVDPEDLKVYLDKNRS